MDTRTRGWRRAQSVRVAGRRRAWHLRTVHGSDRAAVDCLCELARLYFEKRPIGCGCSKKWHGQPRGCGGRAPLRYEVLGLLPYRSVLLAGSLDRLLDKSLAGAWVPTRPRGFGCKDGNRVRVYRWRRLVREMGQAVVRGREPEAAELAMAGAWPRK